MSLDESCLTTFLVIEKDKLEIHCSDWQIVEMVASEDQVAYVRIIGETGEEGKIRGEFSRVTVRNVKQDCAANETETENQESMNERPTG